ncbi:uncharacterized protein MELLADRAFT_85851 [Melampsora larici-populina 98AG31]|uniref:Uncharacterized protein n=1 Tax=Melampsora larici-populina (strain 98AG31 / pathotype 3-4-7) TaxID=747676 RepID=F4SDD1_MELLP|nr:uncharacterized protein MELLADRAFT_85851 [Melampsora larici-populina 98AG31]EGF97345.1 hypothetical protein MELLADRAFT_85851 [Melampsora larici-populina 98AG31]
MSSPGESPEPGFDNPPASLKAPPAPPQASSSPAQTQTEIPSVDAVNRINAPSDPSTTKTASPPAVRTFSPETTNHAPGVSTHNNDLVKTPEIEIDPENDSLTEATNPAPGDFTPNDRIPDGPNTEGSPALDVHILPTIPEISNDPADEHLPKTPNPAPEVSLVNHPISNASNTQASPAPTVEVLISSDLAAGRLPQTPKPRARDTTPDDSISTKAASPVTTAPATDPRENLVQPHVQGPTTHSSTEVGAFRDQDGRPLGTSIPINPGVVATVAPSEPIKYMGPLTLLSNINVQSVLRKRITDDDIPAIYEATLNFLCLRRADTGALSITAETQLERDVQFRVRPRWNLTDFLDKAPNKSLCVPGIEAPYHLPDIFDFDATAATFKPPRNERVEESCVRIMLSPLVSPSAPMVETALKYVLSAVAYLNLDSPISTTPHDFSKTSFPNQTIANGVKAAFHFNQLQDTTPQLLVNQCVRLMWKLHNLVYAILEAVASLRARFRHLEIVKRAPLEDQPRIIAEYEATTQPLGVGGISSKALLALVVFLIGGVRGLLVFPQNANVYGPVKASFFLVLINHLHKNRPVPEPVWKHTQSFILDLLERSLFPAGFTRARTCLMEAVNDDQWQHQDCSRKLLAQVIQMDLIQFCSHQDEHLQNKGLYEDPAFELPECPLNKVKGKDKGKNGH